MVTWEWTAVVMIGTTRVRAITLGILPFLFCLISLISTPGCDSGGTNFVGSGTGGYNTVTSMGITFRWKIDGALLRVIVVAPTRGWVGVGFSPSVRMQDANIIIGYVIGDKAYVSDEYGDGPTTHQPDVYANGTDNIIGPTGRERDGSTELSFAIPLDSGDARDRQIVPGHNYTVMLAYGPDTADQFTTRHSTRTSICVLFQ